VYDLQTAIVYTVVHALSSFYWRECFAQVVVIVVLSQVMHMCNKLHFYLNNHICKTCFCKIFLSLPKEI
jgi:hypothetical protein